MKISACLLLTVLTLGLASAQTPVPIVVAAEPATTTPVARAVAPTPLATSGNALQVMQALKVTNDDLLNKQTATLQRLDELQKAADQIKIYSKRG
ncbi:MAG: hypothetical protein ABI946_01270 [Chthoniobacterales bacterium]